MADWKETLYSLRSNLQDSGEEELKPEISPSEDSIQKTPLSVIIDKKGRNGKIATIIEGFACSQGKVEQIAKQLKQRLGVGGSVREGEILIQGEHKDKVCKLLAEMNFKIR